MTTFQAMWEVTEISLADANLLFEEKLESVVGTKPCFIARGNNLSVQLQITRLTVLRQQLWGSQLLYLQ